METSELDNVDVYLDACLDACLDANCNRVLAFPDKSVHQLYDFFNRDSGATRVALGDNPSSV